MRNAQQTQQTFIEASIDDNLLVWVEAFLVDRKAQNLTPGTIKYYREKLTIFTNYCESQVITSIRQITPDTIRRYLLYLEEAGHNPGGIHSAFRSLRAFMYWWENEVEPDGWKNPIRKVKAPKVPTNPIEPVEIDTVKAMIGVCEKGSFTGDRDHALLLFLLDTGTRAKECLALDITDIDLIAGTVMVKQGKGRKPRSVFLGQKSRKALRSYLKQRSTSNQALWVTDDGDRLSYDGLRGILTRRSKKAGVEEPSLHDFRRAFALNFLRNNPGDIFSLQKLMGHTSLHVLRRYLAQTDQDIQDAHRRGSPVDNAGF